MELSVHHAMQVKVSDDYLMFEVINKNTNMSWYITTMYLKNETYK